jgi:hypothetical protein
MTSACTGTPRIALWSALVALTLLALWFAIASSGVAVEGPSEHGRVEEAFEADEATLLLDATGASRESAPVEELESGALPTQSTAAIEAGRTAQWRLRVVDALDWEPLEGVKVRWSVGDRSGETRTSKEGRAAWSCDRTTAIDANVRIALDGHGAREAKFACGFERTLELVREREFVVQVRWRSGGGPVAGASLGLRHATNGPERWEHAETDVGGLARFPRFCFDGQVFAFWRTADGYVGAESFQLAPDSKLLLLELPDPVECRFVVLDAQESLPIEGAAIGLDVELGERLRTDRNGEVALRLAPTDQELRVEAAGHLQALVKISADRLARTPRFSIPLEPVCDLRVRVLDALGQPVDGATVSARRDVLKTLRSNDGKFHACVEEDGLSVAPQPWVCAVSGLSDALGRVELHGIAFNCVEYRLYASHLAYGIAEPVELPRSMPAERHEIELRLPMRHEPGSVVGRIRCGDTPVSGFVSWKSSGLGRMREFGCDGWFRLEEVPAGRAVLWIQARTSFGQNVTAGGLVLREVDVRANECAEVEFDLGQGLVLVAGEVLGLTSKEAHRTVIALRSADEKRSAVGYLDADFRFRLLVAPDLEGTLTVERPDRAPFVFGHVRPPAQLSIVVGD